MRPSEGSKSFSAELLKPEVLRFLLEVKEKLQQIMVDMRRETKTDQRPG